MAQHFRMGFPMVAVNSWLVIVRLYLDLRMLRNIVWEPDYAPVCANPNYLSVPNCYIDNHCKHCDYANG